MPLVPWEQMYEAMKAEALGLSQEKERLRQRLADCETSLGIWDPTRTSEYWMRHSVQSEPYDDKV